MNSLESDDKAINRKTLWLFKGKVDQGFENQKVTPVVSLCICVCVCLSEGETGRDN